MFTFIVFILLAAVCFFVYVYLTNQITSQRKRIMLLINENNELKNKLNKLMSAPPSPKADNVQPSEVPEIKEENIDEEI